MTTIEVILLFNDSSQKVEIDDNDSVDNIKEMASLLFELPQEKISFKDHKKLSSMKGDAKNLISSQILKDGEVIKVSDETNISQPNYVSSAPDHSFNFPGAGVTSNTNTSASTRIPIAQVVIPMTQAQKDQFMQTFQNLSPSSTSPPSSSTQPGNPTNNIDPSTFSQSFSSIAQNPAALKAITDSPMFTNLFKDPKFFRESLLKNPMFSSILKKNPEIERELRNKDVLNEMADVMKDPVRMSEMFKSMDRQMSQLSFMPGGQAQLKSLYSNLQKPIDSLFKKPMGFGRRNIEIVLFRDHKAVLEEKQRREQMVGRVLEEQKERSKKGAGHKNEEMQALDRSLNLGGNLGSIVQKKKGCENKEEKYSQIKSPEVVKESKANKNDIMDDLNSSIASRKVKFVGLVTEEPAELLKEESSSKRTKGDTVSANVEGEEDGVLEITYDNLRVPFTTEALKDYFPVLRLPHVPRPLDIPGLPKAEKESFSGMVEDFAKSRYRLEKKVRSTESSLFEADVFGIFEKEFKNMGFDKEQIGKEMASLKEESLEIDIAMGWVWNKFENADEDALEEVVSKYRNKLMIEGRKELVEMAGLGFDDVEQNLKALLMGGGSVNEAVELVVQNIFGKEGVKE